MGSSGAQLGPTGHPVAWFAKYRWHADRLAGLQAGEVAPAAGQTIDEAIRLAAAALAQHADKLQRLEPAGERLKARPVVRPHVRARGTRRLGGGQPRKRAVARSSSRGGDSGDPDDPEPAGSGDPVGTRSRVLSLPLHEGAVA